MARRIETEITGDASSFKSATNDAGDSAEDLRSTFEKLQDSNSELSRSIDNLADKVDDLDKVGETADAFGNLEPVFIGVNDNLGVMAEQFGINIGPMQDYVGAAANVAGGMEGIIGGGAALVGQFKTIAPELAPAIAATWSHVTALAAQAAAVIAANAPLILIIGSIALLAAGVYLLVQHWDTIVEKVPLLGAAIDGVKGTVVAAKDIVIGAFTEIPDWLKEHWPEVAVIISGPFAPLVILATDGFGIRSAMIGFVTKLPGELRDGVGDVASTLRDKGSDLITGFADGMSDKFVDAWNFVKAIPGELVEGIGDVGQVLYNAGSALVGGLWNGIKDKWDEVKDKVQAIVDPRNWDIPGRSPLLEAMDHTGTDAGVAFVTGIAKGMELSADVAEGKARELAAMLANVPNDGRVTSSIPSDPRSFGTGPGATRNSYIGGGQDSALPVTPAVGQMWNGLTWTGAYWSQAGARQLAEGEYTGQIAPAWGSGRERVSIIKVELDGQTLATVVNRENDRGY